MLALCWLAPSTGEAGLQIELLGFGIASTDYVMITELNEEMESINSIGCSYLYSFFLTIIARKKREEKEENYNLKILGRFNVTLSE